MYGPSRFSALLAQGRPLWPFRVLAQAAQYAEHVDKPPGRAQAKRLPEGRQDVSCAVMSLCP